MTSATLELVRSDLRRLRNIVEDAGRGLSNAVRELGQSEETPPRLVGELARYAQFEDIAVQLLEQTERHLAELDGAGGGDRTVEQSSLDPGEIELF